MHKVLMQPSPVIIFFKVRAVVGEMAKLFRWDDGTNTKIVGGMRLLGKFDLYTGKI